MCGDVLLGVPARGCAGHTSEDACGRHTGCVFGTPRSRHCLSRIVTHAARHQRPCPHTKTRHVTRASSHTLCPTHAECVQHMRLRLVFAHGPSTSVLAHSSLVMRPCLGETSPTHSNCVLSHISESGIWARLGTTCFCKGFDSGEEASLNLLLKAWGSNLGVADQRSREMGSYAAGSKGVQQYVLQEAGMQDGLPKWYIRHNNYFRRGSVSRRPKWAASTYVLD